MGILNNSTNPISFIPTGYQMPTTKEEAANKIKEKLLSDVRFSDWRVADVLSFADALAECILIRYSITSSITGTLGVSGQVSNPTGWINGGSIGPTK